MTSTVATYMDSIFAHCIGQTAVKQQLYQAIEASQSSSPGAAFTHAWLFTGPPGSGRSTVAQGFAAGLQASAAASEPEMVIEKVLTGNHPDVRQIVPEGLFISVEEIREVIMRAAHKPVIGRWNIIIIEDADRLTESASNALLKTIEEPPPDSIIMLCAPSTDPADISATIKSRCRHVSLVTPTVADIYEALHKAHIDDEMAIWASQVCAGHVGRAKRLARDENSRALRSQILVFPRLALNMAEGLAAVDEFLACAEKTAHALSANYNEKEMFEWKQAMGAGAGKASQTAMRGTATHVKAIEKLQKNRETRMLRDVIDIGLMDLSGLLRDAMLISLGAHCAPIHPDYSDMTQKMGKYIGAPAWLTCLEAVFTARQQIDQNVKTKLALTAMMATFHQALVKE